MPGSGGAQGSIFSIFGSGLCSSSGAQTSTFPLPTNQCPAFSRRYANLNLARISHRTGFLREGGEVQVTESRRDRRLSVAGGRKTACNATKRRIPTSVGILCLLRQAS